MTIEASIYSAIKSLVSNRVFPDTAPLDTVKPYITYSQIGGEVVSYTEDSLPDVKNGRFQFNVWADTRSSCSSLMLQVESALVTTLGARAIGAASSTYDHDMLTYGSMQDFSIWSSR